MSKSRTIIFGVDTPDDYGPASALAAVDLAPLAEEQRAELAARVLQDDVGLVLVRATDG